MLEQFTREGTSLYGKKDEIKQGSFAVNADAAGPGRVMRTGAGSS